MRVSRPSEFFYPTATGRKNMPMVTIRMTAANRELLNQLAKNANMTLQAYCLRKLLVVQDEPREFDNATG